MRKRFKIISPFAEDFDSAMLHPYPPPINIYIYEFDTERVVFYQNISFTLSLIFLFLNDVAFENIGFDNEYFMLQPPGIDTIPHTPESKNYE